MTNPLEGHQRAALMKYAHELKPVATVGKQGLTPAVAAHVDRELAQHELIKIRFTDFKSVRRDITEQLSRDLAAALVQVIGHVGVLYRPAENPEDRTIALPPSRSGVQAEAPGSKRSTPEPSPEGDGAHAEDGGLT
ncbi:MAG: YhbY family RNA-binding protein [Alkalispirochaeta sp.]